MDVQPCWGTLLLKAANPSCVVLVAIFVYWRHVHEEDIGDIRFQIIELHLDSREHPPAERERVRERGRERERERE